jgi:hypothetical protein
MICTSAAAITPYLIPAAPVRKVRALLKMTTAPKNLNHGKAMYRRHVRRVVIATGEQEGPI